MKGCVYCHQQCPNVAVFCSKCGKLFADDSANVIAPEPNNYYSDSYALTDEIGLTLRLIAAR